MGIFWDSKDVNIEIGSI